MRTSPDPPGRVARTDDTEASFSSSIVPAPELPFQMMLQFDTTPDLLPAPDSAVVPTEGVLVILVFICCFQSVLFLRTLHGSHSCQESVGFYLAQFRARLMYFWS